MTVPPPRMLPLRHLAVGLLLVGAALAALWFGLRSIGERTLRGGAETGALAHVQLMRDSAPGLERLLASGTLDAATREQLVRLRRLGETYQFKLYGRDGALLLRSGDLDHADPLADARHAADSAPAEALAGRLVIEVYRDNRRADLPHTYVEAYVPVRHPAADGPVIGVIEISLDYSDRVARLRAAFVQTMAIVLSILFLLGGVVLAYVLSQRRARRRSDERVDWMAGHDALTGLLNRAGFGTALALARARPAERAALQRHERAALICIDLDRFRHINDLHGSALGDEVLRETARRLGALAQPGDLLARLGADEFAWLHHGCGNVAELARLGQRVAAVLSAPLQQPAASVAISASVGIAPDPGSPLDGEALLHQAGAAVARARQAGGGRFALFDADAERAQQERRALALDLGGAIAGGELSLHYQPRFDRDGTTLLGYEALMRWQHAVRGPVEPAVFIALAEETGLIGALGAWALERACREAVRWPKTLDVSVNLSAAQFGGQLDLAGLVRDCLSASGLPATRLVLEVTEALLMRDPTTVSRLLRTLSRSGVRIALDDFGTGYSSLGSLWHFPIDEVKIDLALVKDVGRDARAACVAGSIVSLAHALGLRVVAEGVETPAQAAALRRLGCDAMQGHLLGRPQPPEALDHADAAAGAGTRGAMPASPALTSHPAARHEPATLTPAV
jgi:diguanylate cyclase (GGDEF)-like protein